MITTQAEVRRQFWAEHLTPGGRITRRKIPDYSGNGKMHDTDTRVAFCDYVDSLARNGEISEALAQRVTL